LKNFSIDFPQTNIYIPLQIQAWRFALFNWINNSVLIDSTYNAWPESMLKMIQNTIYLRDSLFKNYKILFVIWDMRELGIKSNQEHKRLYYYLRNFWEIISIWTKTKENFWSHLSNFKYSKNAGKFLYNFLNNSKEKYIILFKWSQNTIFVEEALKEVLVSKNNFQKLVRQSEFWLKKKESY
jgi:UDP-N-acetylmuramyl pentapeptide synthase